ncbi:colanic acid biosynthesis glycosyltransferase WcaI [Mucilaginibacter pallidiroseus]|uniref:Colanic acid biosynthesis glycosyltransferase WcaI n=1 Tax=Mucilaginibacter pallidiroseus TaxID=2599295 RepID=A0A563U8E1_9SPHI|nr:WcaI family glycosyltransferase [Mucilaginibacter pallidiroseus]TWR27583.1 colanic acid biosynthesis glycosyltransferase WcaI [Mucilaginibacter pallidiroseus]
MSKKKILLLSHNFSPEPIGIGKYNGEMISWLLNRGYDCTVITTFPYYPQWKVQKPYKNRWFKREVTSYAENHTKLTIYRCPSYIPKDPTGKQRALQDLSFWVSKFFVVFGMILLNRRYDLIVTIAPPFHLAHLGLLLRKLNGGKLLYHVQDMQIEAARDLKLFSQKHVLNSLFKVETSILKSADYVSSISEGMIRKIKAKVDRDVKYFPNWVDTERFYPIPSRENLKTKWGYSKDDIVFLYSGAVGVKQRLERILVTAQDVAKQPNIKFIICSSGPYMKSLQEQAAVLGLTNISFMDVQPKAIFNEFLNMADIHLVLQISDAADLVMPSKLSTILAVGGASIISASQGTSLHQLAQDHDIGYVIEPQDRKQQDILTNQVLHIAQNGLDLELKRQNARNYAVKHLNVDMVMGNFERDFLG